MRVLRRARLVAASGLLVVSLAACGGGSSAGGPSSEPSSPGVDGGTSSQPPADVSADKGLTEWLAAVCTAQKDTLDPSQLTPDPSEIAADPEKAIKKIIKQYKLLPDQFRAFADELEQIGAPDVENGKELTDAYIDAARAVADALDQALADVGDGGIGSFAGIAKITESPELKAALDRVAKAGQAVGTDAELEAAAAGVPECQGLYS